MMHQNQRRDPSNIIAALNFNLPHIPRSLPKDRESFDVVMSVRIEGKRRKSSRWHIDLTGLYTRINEGNTADPMWKPVQLAIGNDSLFHVFAVFDDKTIKQSFPVTYNQKNGRVVVNAKALCKKILLCFAKEPHKVQEPGAPDTGLQLKFQARMINNNENLYELIPVRMIQEFADEKVPPKVVNYRP